MASKTLTRFLSPLLNWAAPRYQAAVGDVLRKHGLRYEDLYDPLLNQVWICFSSRLLCLSSEHGFNPTRPCLGLRLVINAPSQSVCPCGAMPLSCIGCSAAQDVDEALKRLPQEEVDARNQRLKRAMDLSLKHVSLEKEMQEKQTPYLSYIRVCFCDPVLAQDFGPSTLR